MEFDWPGGDWQTTLKVIGAIFGTYYAAVWLSAVVWAYRDIRERTRDPLSQILAVFMVLVFSLPGLVLYLILRPRHTLADQYERTLEEAALLEGIEEQAACPNCKRHIETEFVVCPYCSNQLKEPCGNCGKPTSNSWVTCPYCAVPKRPQLQPATPGRRAMQQQGRGAPAVPAASQQPLPAPQPAAVAPTTIPPVEPPPRPQPQQQPPRQGGPTANVLVFDEDDGRPRRQRGTAPAEPSTH